MRRGLALVPLVLGACSFDRAGLAPLGGVADAPAAAIDAPIAMIDGKPAAAPACDDQSKDLIACYRFDGDDVKNEPRDGSSYGNDGTTTGASLVDGLPGHGKAMSFSPTAAALVKDDTSFDVQTLTLEMWLYVRALPPAAGRAGLLDENGEYGLFLAPDGAVRCSIGSATDIGLAVTVGAWTHIACTYDGATIQLYQDGAAGASINSMIVIPSAPVDGLALGQNLPSGDHLDGAIDDVRVWRVARSRAQVCADAGLPCP
jgi:hypothetical protein